MRTLYRMSPLGLVLACAVIINLGYVASNLYDLPGVVSVILIPCALVLCMGWLQKSIKRTIALTFGVIFLSGLLMQASLSAPVLLGVIEDQIYSNMFVYSVFLRVVRYIFITSFFTLLTALVAGLAFE
jgi:hypothetical protein